MIFELYRVTFIYFLFQRRRYSLQIELPLKTRVVKIVLFFFSLEKLKKENFTDRADQRSIIVVLLMLWTRFFNCEE